MPPIHPPVIAHVVYRTRRFAEMLQWYATVFGARIQYQGPGLAFMTTDDEHHRFAFADMSLLQPNGTDTERQGSIGVDHLGYNIASLRDLMQIYAQLKEQGITPYWSIHHGITASLYYADPDGNQSEFQVGSFATSDEATAFMKESFSLNPIGVEFDPEDWLARLQAGTPESELLTRATHEPVSPLRGEFARLL